ncbi:MAG: DUF58 domain-containing protein [Planctomycetaceae bacterium]|nr:DUF58 domain-containing protein [Planctomycetaceae bacterium]
MSSSGQDQTSRSVTLSAGVLTQFLASVACFLGAYVLPLTFEEFKGISQRVLLFLGTAALLLGLLNLFFGRRLSRILVRAGRRSRVVIPREGIGYLAIMLALAVGALLGHRNLPLLVFGMMAGPFILNGWLVYIMLKQVSVSRSAPKNAIVGESVSVELTVHNGKRWLASHMIEVRDAVSSAKLKKEQRELDGIVTFVRIPPREDRTGRYQLQFSRRGRYTLGPLRVSSRFPLGIGERGQTELQMTDVIVRPGIGRLLPAWSRQLKEMSESSHHQQSRNGLFDDEFHRIREYRSDDNPRMIHWRSTARRGRLMIREYHQNRHADSLIILDLPVQPGWSEHAMEMAISLAATICVEQTSFSSGGHYFLAISGSAGTFVSSRSPGGFREEALDALAVCAPSPRASLDDVLTGAVSTCALRDERLILITPRPQHAAEVLRTIEARHLLAGIDLVSRATIVAADPSTLLQVFQPPETSLPSTANYLQALSSGGTAAPQVKASEITNEKTQVKV